jgi:hypothetical protein
MTDGKPGPRVLAKVVDTLDDICGAFIARSPFIIVASSSNDLVGCKKSALGITPVICDLLDSAWTHRYVNA